MSALHRTPNAAPSRPHRAPVAAAALAAFVALFAIASVAVSAPETEIVSGASGLTNLEDATFWWAGVSDDPTAPIAGYRIALDGAAPTFTRQPTATFYDLADGEHTLSVAAVGIDLEEDATPATTAFSVSGEFRVEVESNNFDFVATQAFSGMPIRATSIDASDADWYILTPEATARHVALTFRRPDAGIGSTVIRVYRDDPAFGDVVFDGVVSIATKHRLSATFGVDAVPYYALVQMDDVAQIGSRYTLTLTSHASGEGQPATAYWDTEPNDVDDFATVVPVSDETDSLVLFGATDVVGDEDWYRLSLNVSSTRLLRLTFARPESAGSAVVEAFAGAAPAAENQIALLAANSASDQFATFETAAGLGDVLVRVVHDDEPRETPYALLLDLSTVASGDAYELEPNGVDPRVNARSPNALPINSAVVGQSWAPDGDVDWYRVDVDRAGVLTVEFSRPAGLGSTTTRLYNSNFLLVNEAEATAANGQSALLSSVATAGLYYIELTPSGESPHAAYALSATLESPGIFSAEHSASGALTLDETLRVSLLAPAGASASFSIGDARTNLPMFDDGAHDDGAANDGEYAGSYAVRSTDELLALDVVARVSDISGDSSERVVGAPVTLDGRAPSPVASVAAADAPDDDGGVLLVEWAASDAADLAQYRVYVEPTPIASTAGLTAALRTSEVSALVPVDASGVRLFVAVTAADRAGNESVMAPGSVVGPVVAEDNRLPSPVTQVVVENLPADFGGAARVRWAPAFLPDFAEYRVYATPETVENIAELTPAARIANPFRTDVDIAGLPLDVPVFLTLTVVDMTGNESALAPTSTAGPVLAVAEATADTSLLDLVGPVGVVRGGSARLRWARYPAGRDEPVGDVLVTLDGSGSRVVSGASATYHDLAPGRHLVRVVESASGVAATHAFHVDPFSPPEVEPNDTPAQAEALQPNEAAIGAVSNDADWFRLDVPGPGAVDVTVTRRSGVVEARVYRQDGAANALAYATSLADSTPRTDLSVGVVGEPLFVEVRGDGAYELSYTWVWTPAFTVEREPNGTSTQATEPLQAEAPPRVRGSIAAEGDIDWFALPPLTLGNIELRASAVSGVARLRVFRGGDQVGALTTGEQEQFGDLFLRVDASPYSIAVDGDPGAEYEVAVVPGDASAVREFEPNDAIARATPLPLDSVVVGSAWSDADRDVYRVETPVSGTLVAALSRPDATATTTVRILGGSGAELSASASAPLSDGTEAQASTGPGTSYVTVETDGDDREEYELRVTSFADLRHGAAGTLKAGDEVGASLAWRAGAQGVLELVDGSGAREVAALAAEGGSGAYAAKWTVRDGEDGVDLSLRARMTADGQTWLVTFPGSIAIDTTPPRILTASHDARVALGVGSTLRVSASAEEGAFGSFTLLRSDGAAARADVPMVETEAGQYSGEFVVGAADHLEGGRVRVSFEDEVGNRATRDISRRLTIDTLPPAVVSVAHDASGVLVEGDTITVTAHGDAGARASFAILVDGDTAFREAIPLFDDGAHDDGDADDGVYRGRYTARPGDTALDAVVRARLEDDAGNAAFGLASAAVSIDASTPTIERATHNADRPLALGDTLRVTVVGSPGVAGSFSIQRADGTAYRTDLRLTEGDADGEYTGTFDVVLDADVVDAVVTVTLVKTNGKSVTRSLASPVTFDTTAPASVLGVTARDVQGDEGGVIALSWDATTAADFARYEVYRSTAPVATTDGLVAEAIDLSHRTTDSLLVEAPLGVAHYFAVVAVDEAGNPSRLSLDIGGSVSSRVEALDNLPPPPVRNVLAIDRPNDGGGVLSVVWEPTPARDFAEYRVYVSAEPFPQGGQPGVAPVVRLPAPWVTLADAPTPVDGAELYVAVSVVDTSGNESVVGATSASGQVASDADGAPLPGAAFAVFSGPNGVGRHASPAFRWNRFAPDGTPIPDYRFSLDGGPERYTSANEAPFSGLTSGEHVLAVAPADGSLPVATRRFRVDAVSLPEREPNDSPDAAMALPPGVAVDGVLLDESDIARYRLQLSAFSQVGLHLTRARAGGARMALVSLSVASGSGELASVYADGLERPRAHTAMALEAGEYLVHVTGDAGPYRAVVAAHPIPVDIAWDTEPNDDPRRATRVGADAAEITGAANRERDVDWYRIPAPADGAPLMDVSLAQPASHDVSLVEFYHDAPGSEPVAMGAVALSPDEPSIRLRSGIRQGDLLMKVSPAAGSVYGARVAFAPLPPDTLVEAEPNGDVALASPVAPGARLDGSLWGEDDTDWYRMDVVPSANGLVALTVEAGATGVALDAEAFTVGLESLGAFLPSSSVTNSYGLAVTSSARSFFVRVRGETTGYGLAALELSAAGHDARGPLGMGEALVVTVRGGDGWNAHAEIAGHGIAFALDPTTPGTYTGSYVVEAGRDVRDAAVVVAIDAPTGLSVRVPLTPTVTLDTVPPAMSDAWHSGARPLRSDEELRISATAEAGSRVGYEVSDTASGGVFRVLGDLFDDGQHEDGDAGDGLYAGVYRVQPGDAAAGAVVSVSATDAVGNVRTVTAPRPVDLDTTPPLVEQVSHDGASVLREGNRLVVTARGEVGARGAFSVEGVREGLPLVDDGTRGDETPGDGVYVGGTLIVAGDNAAGAIVSVELTDPAGNVATAYAALPVSIDTSPPELDTVTHSATGPLREGDRLVVRVSGEIGGTATFDIGAARQDIAMFDDGAGDDDDASDGVYTGAYIVRQDDDIAEATITARVADRNGNVGFRAATSRVTLDAVPPPPVHELAVEDSPGDQGNRLRLSWTAIDGAPDFLRYHIYRETAPIRSTRGLTPVSTEIVGAARQATELDVPANNVDYYFAIAAVDVARNESALSDDGGSAFGPVRATDDLPPASVLGVASTDAPADDGGFVVVSWTSQSDETDFGGYAVFLDTARAALDDLAGREADLVQADRTVTDVLVPTTEDVRQFYVGVVARDINGNYSAVTDASSAGPVASTDDTAPQPIVGVQAADAPGDEGGRLSVTWDVPDDTTVVEFEVYLSPTPIRSSDDLAGLASAVSSERPDDVDQASAGAIATTQGNDAEWHVAVVAVDGGGNRSDVGAQSVAGPVRSVSNVLTDTGAAVVRAGFDPQTSVRVPAAVARPGVRIDIYAALDATLLRAADEANLNLAAANIDEATEADLRGSVRHIDASPAKFTEPLVVTVSITPPDSSEVARDLRLFRLNTDAIPARWDLVPGEQTVDTGQGVVSARSTTMGVFRVARLLLPRELSRVTVAPNPFRPDHDGVVTLRNLTEGSEVEVFTLDARRVARLSNNASGMATWDGRNDGGAPVVSGLYIYLIRSPNDRRVGQILVIR